MPASMLEGKGLLEPVLGEFRRGAGDSMLIPYSISESDSALLTGIGELALFPAGLGDSRETDVAEEFPGFVEGPCCRGSGELGMESIGSITLGPADLKGPEGPEVPRSR